MTSTEIITRVTSQVQIALKADPGLEDMIPTEVQIAIARQGWSDLVLDDPQGDLVMWTSLYALIPRMISKLMDGVSRTKTGPMETEYEKAIDYLKLLRETVKDMITMAQKAVAPQDLDEGERPKFAPSCGIRSF